MAEKRKNEQSPNQPRKKRGGHSPSKQREMFYTDPECAQRRHLRAEGDMYHSACLGCQIRRFERVCNEGDLEICCPVSGCNEWWGCRRRLIVRLLAASRSDTWEFYRWNPAGGLVNSVDWVDAEAKRLEFATTMHNNPPNSEAVKRYSEWARAVGNTTSTSAPAATPPPPRNATPPPVRTTTPVPAATPFSPQSATPSGARNTASSIDTDEEIPSTPVIVITSDSDSRATSVLGGLTVQTEPEASAGQSPNIGRQGNTVTVMIGLPSNTPPKPERKVVDLLSPPAPSAVNTEPSVPEATVDLDATRDSLEWQRDQSVIDNYNALDRVRQFNVRQCRSPGRVFELPVQGEHSFVSKPTTTESLSGLAPEAERPLPTPIQNVAEASEVQSAPAALPSQPLPAARRRPLSAPRPQPPPAPQRVVDPAAEADTVTNFSEGRVQLSGHSGFSALERATRRTSEITEVTPMPSSGGDFDNTRSDLGSIKSSTASELSFEGRAVAPPPLERSATPPRLSSPSVAAAAPSSQAASAASSLSTVQSKLMSPPVSPVRSTTTSSGGAPAATARSGSRRTGSTSSDKLPARAVSSPLSTPARATSSPQALSSTVNPPREGLRDRVLRSLATASKERTSRAGSAPREVEPAPKPKLRSRARQRYHYSDVVDYDNSLLRGRSPPRLAQTDDERNCIIRRGLAHATALTSQCRVLASAGDTPQVVRLGPDAIHWLSESVNNATAGRLEQGGPVRTSTLEASVDCRLYDHPQQDVPTERLTVRESDPDWLRRAAETPVIASHRDAQNTLLRLRILFNQQSTAYTLNSALCNTVIHPHSAVIRDLLNAQHEVLRQALLNTAETMVAQELAIRDSVLENSQLQVSYVTALRHHNLSESRLVIDLQDNTLPGRSRILRAIRRQADLVGAVDDDSISSDHGEG